MYRFTDDCIIGIQEIDEEHKRLFQVLNETMELLKAGGASRITAKNLLIELKEYAQTHFAHEEAYMKKIGDMELERQKKEHAQFTEKVNSYEISDLTEETGRQIAEELLPYMAKWLYHHILGSDIMIGKFTETKKTEDAFAFTEKYKTGIALIDDEHKRLFEIIKEANDVIQAQLLHDKYDEIIHILEELKEYTVLHFGDEERYMESIQYEGLGLQRIAHTAFVDRINEINLDEVDEKQQAYLEELVEFLLGWLTNHILKMDKQIPTK
ncbi:MAG: bacteriohemerythrin [Lachnospiraceae bacterium]